MSHAQCELFSVLGQSCHVTGIVSYAQQGESSSVDIASVNSHAENDHGNNSKLEAMLTCNHRPDESQGLACLLCTPLSNHTLQWAEHHPNTHTKRDVLPICISRFRK